jgi:Ca2+-binding RTX toxin-like protein
MINKQHLQTVQSQLSQFAAQSNFNTVISTAFGNNVNQTQLQQLRQQWLSGNFSIIPNIQVLSQNEIGTANGAYASSLDTIFLSADFLATASAASIASVLLEEIGHRIDQLLNGGVDSAGDEGEIFSRLVSGENLSSTVLASLQAQNDRGFVTINGRTVAVENAAGITITGSSLADTITPTASFYTTTANDDTIYAGSGNDTVDGGNGNDYIAGDSGNDILYGGNGNDALYGGAGNDVLDGDDSTSNDGNNTLDGGTGNDTYIINSSGDLVTESSTIITEIDSVFSYINYTLTANVENLTLADSLFGIVTNINGVGNGLNNLITGGIGNNFIDGFAGNNTLNGGGGNDTLYGGNANDTLDGGTGGDFLDGRLGNNLLRGGTGNDTYIVNSSGDLVSELSAIATEIDGVFSYISYTLTANVENLSLADSFFGVAVNLDGVGNELNNLITGGIGNNVFDGGSGNDTITGGGGNDVLYGGVGADRMVGGTGNDVYYIDNAADVVIEAAGGLNGIDSVFSTALSFVMPDNIETGGLFDYATGTNITGNSLDNYIVGNLANNVLNGGLGDDLMYGYDGNDTLIGGSGNDYLDGSTFAVGNNGNDYLVGGIGVDTFVLNKLGIDTIADFAANEKLVISASAFGANGLVSGVALTAAQFRIGAGLTTAAAGNTAQRFIFNTSNNGLYFDASGSGGAASIQIATLTGVAALSTTNFSVVI